MASKTVTAIRPVPAKLDLENTIDAAHRAAECLMDDLLRQVAALRLASCALAALPNEFDAYEVFSAVCTRIARSVKDLDSLHSRADELSVMLAQPGCRQAAEKRADEEKAFWVRLTPARAAVSKESGPRTA